jgi:hypothetical protein
MSNESLPTVFEQLLKPIDEFIRKQDAELPRHPNQKFAYYDFFRLLMYYFAVSGKSFKLFIVTQLNNGLLPASLNLRQVPYSTIKEAFDRFPVWLFREVFQHLLNTLSFKHLPELATLGTLYCIDGSLFPVINSMQWATYTSKHQALKLHLCFELNRMIPVEFLVSAANDSERQALLKMLKTGVTYIADRGYMSFRVCHQLLETQVHFVFRVKTNLLYSVTETLLVQIPENIAKLFSNVSDQLISYTNDKFKHTYRLVTFTVGKELFYILTDRRDLTTFQVIMLYAYRWQIELLFRFLKRTMNGVHLIKQDRNGVTIQFYAMLIVALLQLHLKQTTVKEDSGRTSSATTTESTTESETQKSNLLKIGFLESIGKKLKKYWKIGINWLTALKELLPAPFDERARGILSSS